MIRYRSLARFQVRRREAAIIRKESARRAEAAALVIKIQVLVAAIRYWSIFKISSNAIEGSRRPKNRSYRRTLYENVENEIDVFLEGRWTKVEIGSR